MIFFWFYFVKNFAVDFFFLIKFQEVFHGSLPNLQWREFMPEDQNEPLPWLQIVQVLCLTDVNYLIIEVSRDIKTNCTVGNKQSFPVNESELGFSTSTEPPQIQESVDTADIADNSHRRSTIE